MANPFSFPSAVTVLYCPLFPLRTTMSEFWITVADFPKMKSTVPEMTQFL